MGGKPPPVPVGVVGLLEKPEPPAEGMEIYISPMDLFTEIRASLAQAIRDGQD